jgi:hypothetical protein
MYEATVTVEGFGGWAIPLIPMFNARAESGVGPINGVGCIGTGG